MNHLKLFEDINLDGFEKIPEEESFYSKGLTNTEFSKKESDTLINIGFYKSRDIYYYNDKDNERGIYVIKTFDSWYYVEIAQSFKDDLFYRCDQWDGLLNCLKKEINTNDIVNESSKGSLYSKVILTYGSENKKITSVRVNGLDVTNSVISMNDSQIKKIEDIFNKIGDYYLINKYSAKSGCIIDYLKFVVNKTTFCLWLLDDDWYIIEWMGDTWKCDGLDGLKECLKWEMSFVIKK